MGDFRITIDAVGGHGCNREANDGDRLVRCHRDDCPDCQAERFVQQLMARGCSIHGAKLEHWPKVMHGGGLRPDVPTHQGGPGPVDDLLLGHRTGKF